MSKVSRAVLWVLLSVALMWALSPTTPASAQEATEVPVAPTEVPAESPPVVVIETGNEAPAVSAAEIAMEILQVLVPIALGALALYFGRKGDVTSEKLAAEFAYREAKKTATPHDEEAILALYRAKKWTMTENPDGSMTFAPPAATSKTFQVPESPPPPY